MAELACVRGPDPLLEDRAQSHGSSPFGDQSSGVTARSRRSSCGVADRCIPCGTLPHRSAVFRVPRILFGCPSRSSPRSPHGGRGRLRFFHSRALERGSIMPAFRRSRSFRFDHPLGGRGRARSFSSHLSVQKVRSAFTPASAFVTRVRARSPCGVRARSLPRSPRGVRACYTITHLAMDFVPASAFASRCPLARLRARSPCGVRARSTFVNNLSRSSPPSMFARLTALGHFRRRCSTSAALTSLCSSDTLRCRRCPHS